MTLVLRHDDLVDLLSLEEVIGSALAELTPKYVAKIPDAPLGYKISYDAVKGEASVVRE